MEIMDILNGVASALQNRESLIAENIAKEFDLDLDAVNKVIRSTCESHKITMKPQKRQPRKVGMETKPKKTSGYTVFFDENCVEAKRLLMEDEDERTFKNSRGGSTTIDPNTFLKKTGEPKLTQIAQKVASMWALVSAEDKKEYNERALTYEKPVKEKKNPKKGIVSVNPKKGKKVQQDEEEQEEAEDQGQEGEEEQDEQEDEEGEEQEDEEEQPKKPAPKRPVSRGRGGVNVSRPSPRVNPPTKNGKPVNRGPSTRGGRPVNRGRGGRGH